MAVVTFGSNHDNTVCLDTDGNLPLLAPPVTGSFTAPNIGTTTAISGLQLPGQVIRFDTEFTGRSNPSLTFLGSSGIRYLKNSVNSLVGATVVGTDSLFDIGDGGGLQTASTPSTYWFVTLAPTFGPPGATGTVSITYRSYNANIADSSPAYTLVGYNESSPNVWTTPAEPTLILNSSGLDQTPIPVQPTFAYKATNVNGSPFGAAGYSNGYPFPDGIEPLWPTTLLRNQGQIVYFRYHQTFDGSEFADPNGTVLFTTWFSNIGFLRAVGAASFTLNGFQPLFAGVFPNPARLYDFFKLRAVIGENIIFFGVGGNSIIGMHAGEMAFATIQFEVAPVGFGRRSFAQVIG